MDHASPPQSETTEAPHAGEHLALLAADPKAWCVAIPLLFGALASFRLNIPSHAYFDEIHYLPAARELLGLFGDGGAYINREHPLLGKEMLAIGMALFGDNPIGWRIMPLLCGVLGLAASMRALWHASHDRFATIAYGVLLASGFHLFVFSRIAMLDIFMATALAVAAWQFAAAIRRPEQGRWRLAATGAALGFAMAAKWNAVPLAMVPGIAFLVARFSAGRRRFFTSRRGIPIPGVSLIEAGLWLGLLPLLIYALTFAPGYWLGDAFHPSPLARDGLIAFHGEILELQQQVLKPHTYQSNWPQWVLNTRGIWYLYENVDGAQRGILLIGNPLSMLAGLFALAWCALDGWKARNWAKLAVVIGYAVSLGLWLVAPKPVQFYYHYFVPSFFLLGALALASADLVRSRWHWAGYGLVAGSLAMFAVFYPILSAAPLDGPMSFAKWTWIAGWR